ncbi:hypothetical protein PTSG_11961 [Salpingoeca rosetta]|uniref:Probable ubiquitin carboxyl-terminal hydrolase MINDY-4 n=1 Tax=Salpingoeca rosetta (strain ATCC 50818 / BSB-021) TaxID=946362 RepID=F2U455_SALR5|nr:uncharacterized protein PTSG_11961 [Salpingoeca rosetta]EGD82421.1 hypothetical protein PTSG_11961 [Salpingoeca rosetta]|eukprot:XP_004995657.1 hypothetical protein PTSG_11961 [Salpingoeca rosetta]
MEQQEELALALVREFLSSHGLKKTVRMLDNEKPRTEASITRRSDIARSLGIQTWIKQNKARPAPLPSMLEVIAENVATQQQGQPSAPQKSKSTSGAYSAASVTESLGIGKLSLDRPAKSRVSARATAAAVEDLSAPRPITRRGVARVAGSAGHDSSDSDSDSKDDDQALRPSRTATKPTTAPPPPQPPQSATVPARARATAAGRRVRGRASPSGLVMEDVDELEIEDEFGASVSVGGARRARPAAPRVISSGRSRPQVTASAARGRTIGADEAVKLKRVVFGSSRSAFNDAWLRQNFVFNSTVKGLQYGLVQHEGGPCGVLAVVQAMVLKELLFGSSPPTLEPTPEQQHDALVAAITSILLRIQTDGEHILAVVGTKKAANLKPSFKCDGVTEKLTLISCTSEFDLKRAVKENINQFTRDGAPGAILLLYSAVLTRGLSSIRDDMDEDGSKLIGSHCYCTQDLVNLLLVGYACSNTHDGDKRLGSGKDVLVLKGIRKQSDIGLLSLFEHYGSCEVGLNFKSPTAPIWIIYAESHFTVLFSRSKALAYSSPSAPFDICYYDQLAGLEQHYNIQIDPSANVPRPDDKEVLPPLEHCIRTKWKGAAVDWRDCEPLY